MTQHSTASFAAKQVTQGVIWSDLSSEFITHEGFTRIRCNLCLNNASVRIGQHHLCDGHLPNGIEIPGWRLLHRHH